MAGTCDVCIAGGAVIGSAIAWHLARRLGPGHRILVVEPDPSYARSASALSAGSIRQQFSAPVNIAASLYGIAFLRSIGDRLAVLGAQRPDPGLREGGYLYVATPGAGSAVLAANQAVQAGAGADILLLDRPALAAAFPWLATDDLGAGTYGRSGEGWFDGYGLLQAFRAAARAAGVEYRQAAVCGVERGDGRVTAVRLDDGATVTCGAFVVAAGASGARHLAMLCGFAVPIYAKKRSVFSFSARESLPGFPLLIDTSGVWVRPEGDGYISGYSPDDLDETDHGGDFEVDWPLFERVIWPALAHRVPAFEALRPGRAWAGHYDMNLFDHNALVGRMPGLENAYLAAGFSGHGLQQAPAVGRGIAELIAGGRYETLDLGDLGCERLASGRRVLERNVI